MVAADIGAYLTDQSLVDGTTGWTLRIGMVTPQPDKIVALFDGGGFRPFVRIGMDIPELRLRVRGDRNGYSAASAKVQVLYRALHGLAEQTINGVYYVSVEAMSAPEFIGIDANDRPHFRVNFVCRRARP